MPFQLLLLLALSVRSAEHLTVGKEFIAVFPENIAYYHPSPPHNKLRITALHNDTKITIEPSYYNSKSPLILQSGEIEEVDIDAELELKKDKTSVEKVVTITSDKEFSVEILSHKNNSIQTALLIPTEHLSQEYQVLPIPQIQQTSQPTSDVTDAVTERSPFRLIIVNNKEDNKISVDGDGGSPYELDPRQVLQVWVYSGMVGKLVKGDKPFLALFSHSCAVQFECTCGALYTPLQPTVSTPSRFILPPVFSEEAQDQTYLLKPSGGQSIKFTEGSLEVSGPLVLQRPGLLMNLIPEAEFGSCFAIHRVTNATQNWAVIVAPAASTVNVMIGNDPVQGQWKSVSGTNNEYKYAKIQLNAMKNIIWNKSDLMAVWFMGKVVNKNSWFGNPAARLSVDPDYRGCVIKPEKLEVLEEKVSWKESILACKSRNLTLISLSDQNFQDQVYRRILALEQDLTALWMGMRKRSYTGEWYWLNEEPLNHVDWSKGFPSQGDLVGCAQINLTDSSNLGWMNKHCCDQARAVCYQPPELLTFQPS